MAFHYEIKAMRHGSNRYGPCEICGKHCDTTYYQVETRDYQIDDIDRQVAAKLGVTLSARTHHECASKFGHEECLVKVRR